MKKIIFLYSGEGTCSSDSSFKLLKHSTYWSAIESILDSKMGLNLEEIWQNEIGKHRCPFSPLLTVVTQICLSDVWSEWGYRPDVVVGHSVGELSAAYQAGLYSLEDILELTFRIGETAANLEGVMLHGILSDRQQQELSPLILSSLNFRKGSQSHATLSGYPDEAREFLKKNPGFVTMRLPHPWHHPDYHPFSDKLPPIRSGKTENFRFVSGLTGNFENRLNADHWKKWLVSPMDFISSMQAIKNKFNNDELQIIEIGFHPVLDQCCDIFDNYRYVSSMFRGEDELDWILHQRKRLNQNLFVDRLRGSIEEFRPDVDFNTSLAYQGFTSLSFAELADLLQIYFPNLAPQDFFRYKTINQLINHFGAAGPVDQPLKLEAQKNEVVISAMSCRLPSSVETLTQFWDMLSSGEDQVKANAGRSDFEAGFLNDEITRFDHKYFNISQAEAQTMDPQQMLALELTELLFKDADIDLADIDKKRIGVYIGVWNQEYRGDRNSAYYPTGTNPSIIASRISYHFDLRGPSWVSNTACSSSLVAIHYAAKDIEAGRVDYAIAGGVNMILGNDFTDKMRNSGFLSKSNRCKVFDNSADGYVRAEGGGLVLLANKKLTNKYYAELSGSAINQNGARSQILSAPHPEAQEELILEACRNASIRPQDIAYIECHGTGTKIGDPIEISAIQRTIAKGRKDRCLLGSVKSNIGHLESAAGIAGLIKSVLSLYHGTIPPNLHYHLPNQYIDLESFKLEVVSEATRINGQSHMGISSFGFGGTNAHIIIQGAEERVKKKIENIAIPFDRARSSFLRDYYRLVATDSNRTGVGQDFNPNDREVKETVESVTPQTNNGNGKLSKKELQELVYGLFFKVTSIETIDPDVELIEQGLDSMSATEFITQLQASLAIELDSDLLFEHPLPDQLIDEIYALM